ncbi:MAG: D-alanine--D-alanine ligase [Candidatus Paracaedibacteraceae bacterium]|nr:D-alanine--D-alanine ligase [Candidatus Paracaedibacteraceae bacterium]
MKKKIIVLMGGWSNERDVSISSGKGVARVLADMGYDVIPLDLKRELSSFIETLNKEKPDIVFNALHGTGGEDGVIQGVLDMMGIPYTHSGVTASAIAMDKILSRRVFMQAGIPVPDYKLLPFNEFKTESQPFEFPYVAKPLSEGSSRGVSIIHNTQDHAASVNAWTFGDHVLIERYIPGREIQIAVLDGKAIGAIELKPHSGFYDYEAKYTDGKTIHIMPAPLDARTQALMYAYAENAHTVLGCKGITRSDFRLNDMVTPHHIAILEINTQPGLTPLSLVPEIAAYYGTTFPELLTQMVERATCAN